MESSPFSVLPKELLSATLTRVPRTHAGAVRLTCRAFRTAFDGDVTEVTLRWAGRPRRQDIRELRALLTSARLPLLTSVDAGVVRFNSFTVAASLPHLTALRVQQERHQDHNPLASLDLSPLSACTALLHLDLSDCRVHDSSLGDTLRDLRPLAACVALRLRHLDLGGAGHLQDIAPLAACTALRSLSLRNCPRVRDVRPLAACVQLTDLDLTRVGCGRAAADFGPLTACMALSRFGCERRANVTLLLAALPGLHVERD